MASGQLTTLVRHLRRLAGILHEDSLSDRQLLERFAAQHDEDAFRTLVQRHAALVLGVCRRVLHHAQDAEDAFQATFLVLARKARAVRWHESIAGWLSQAAYRLAAELRGKAARQRLGERQAAALPRAAPAPGWRELCTLLNDELHRLPEKYRVPLLLCYLEGDTRDQAAAKLGWSLRTLERRLEQGRALLRDRLTRHGVTLSAALLAARLAQDATAGQSAGLAVDLGRAAVLFAKGTEATAIPRRVVDLAERAVRPMFLTKLTAGVALVLTVGLLAIGSALQAQGTPKAPPQVVYRADPPGPERQANGPVAPRKVGPKEAERTEEAFAAGLQWLARQQAPAGHWPLLGATGNDVAGTAFGLLPFLAAGETHKQTGPLHPYARNVKRGLEYLVQVQLQEGQFGGGMYAHALATWALCEAYGLTRDDRLKEPAQRAVNFIVHAQHTGGGWRYVPRQPGDTSVSSWHILALKHGAAAGLRVPAETFKRASAYLDAAAAQDGSYGYVPGAGAGTPSMTAAALLCRLHLGWAPRHAGVGKGVGFLQRTPPGGGAVNIYYYHYATRVMEAVGGEAWRAWEPKMRMLLLDRQESAQADAAVRGSWPTAGDAFGQAGGRMMTTSLSLLTLQACTRQDSLPPLAARELQEQELAGLWAGLGKVDFLKARRDMRLLAAAARQTVPFLKKQLQPAPPVDSRRIARLIAALDDANFATREKALAELKTFKELARPALEQALQNQPPLELRQRALHLLKEMDKGPPAEQVRALRAVEVLAQIATPPAREFLQELSRGAPEAPLTQEARSALKRLSSQKPAR